MRSERKQHPHVHRKQQRELEPPTTSATTTNATTTNATTVKSTAQKRAHAEGNGEVHTPGASSIPVGALEHGASQKGASMFITRGTTAVVEEKTAAPSTSVPTQSRAFMTKVVIELTKARDRLNARDCVG